MPGRYGEVNILQKWVNMEEADLIYGGEELAEKDGDVTGSKKTIIRPKSDYGSRVKINDRDTAGTNAYNPNEDKPYVFDASYEPYFTPEEEEKLAFDYQDRTDRHHHLEVLGAGWFFHHFGKDGIYGTCL